MGHRLISLSQSPFRWLQPPLPPNGWEDVVWYHLTVMNLQSRLKIDGHL